MQITHSYFTGVIYVQHLRQEFIRNMAQLTNYTVYVYEHLKLCFKMLMTDKLVFIQHKKLLSTIIYDILFEY